MYLFICIPAFKSVCASVHFRLRVCLCACKCLHGSLCVCVFSRLEFSIIPKGQLQHSRCSFISQREYWAMWNCSYHSYWTIALIAMRVWVHISAKGERGSAMETMRRLGHGKRNNSLNVCTHRAVFSCVASFCICDDYIGRWGTVNIRFAKFSLFNWKRFWLCNSQFGLYRIIIFIEWTIKDWGIAWAFLSAEPLACSCAPFDLRLLMPLAVRMCPSREHVCWNCHFSRALMRIRNKTDTVYKCWCTVCQQAMMRASYKLPVRVALWRKSPVTELIATQRLFLSPASGHQSRQRYNKSNSIILHHCTSCSNISFLTDHKLLYILTNIKCCVYF